jgi:hypothetical protein
MYKWMMRYPSALLAAVLCAAVLATHDSSAAPARKTIAVSNADTVALGHMGTSSGATPKGCVKSPVTFLPSVAPKNGATPTVKVGAVVYVELVEAEKYLSWPTGTKPPPRVFPWAAARSSNPSVLQRMALCPSRTVSTLPVVAYAFRALRQGTATLTAPIAPAWKRVKPARRRGLHPYRATVIVAS